MNDITAATIAALATIDAELGMSEDGCNSTARTLTAIRLLHSVHLDDVAEIARLERALKLQRNAALTLADASAAVSGARLEQARKLFAESRPESVESERAMNAILTADVERLERELAVVTELRQHGCECSDADACRYARERDAARAEAEALRKDAERYRYARREDLIGRLGQDPFGDCHCDFDSIDDAAIDAAIAKEKP